MSVRHTVQLSSTKSVFAYFLTTDEAIITKLDRNIKQVKIYTIFLNLRDKKALSMSSDLLLHFGIPSISVEWAKLETSNLVRGLTTRSRNEKCKSRSEGAWPTSRDLLLQ